MNKFVKVSLGVLVLLSVMLCLFYVINFRVGSSSYKNININKVVISSDSIVINGEFSKDNLAFKDYSYSVKGDKLYLIINSVLVSNKYSDRDFSIKLKEDGLGIKYIYLSDGKDYEVIYKN